MSLDYGRARLWAQKWRWYERNSLPWNRLAIHREMASRGAFARWPIQGNVLEALREGRLEIGEHTLFEPQVWLTAPGDARIRIGAGCFLNIGTMVAAVDLVEIGDHCMFANGCFVTDGSHRFDDPETPVPWQGFTSKGPTRVGDSVWCGANVVITSGVTVGERCVIGANSVVTQDLPPHTIAAGSPAKVIREIPGRGQAPERPPSPG
jgi:acetyltransferase-like isoleucine patch superfamily enzyme